jgi:DNA-binding IclR family transcriptional regulator
MSQSAVRAMRLLEYLAERGPTKLSDISHGLGLNKSTAYRFLTSLITAGYAEQEPGTKAYRLTLKIVGLSAQVLDRMEMRDQVRPHLEELAASTSETSHLAVLDDLEIVYVDKVDGGQAVNMASRIGARGACHSTALGKVLLAARPPSEWERYVEGKGLPARTERTIKLPGSFYDELQQVAKRGYAFDDVENEDGIRCVAAPIRDHTGAVVAAMSVSGWTVSMTRGRMRAIARVVTAQAEQASAALGHTLE